MTAMVTNYFQSLLISKYKSLLLLNLLHGNNRRARTSPKINTNNNVSVATAGIFTKRLMFYLFTPETKLYGIYYLKF